MMKHGIYQVAVLAAIVSASAFAADYTWMSSPADALWNTASLNWNTSEAWVDGNNAFFGSSSSKTVTVDGNRTAADITVNGYTFNGSSTLSWTGTMTISGTTSINAPLADNGNGLRFAPNAHVFLNGRNTHTGGTYVGGSYNVAFGLSTKDAAFGPVPTTPQTNIVVTSNKYATFYVTGNTELNANRHILIEDGAWCCFAGQGNSTFRIKGEIHGEILSGQRWPTTTHLLAHVRGDWKSHVILDPGEGHTNDVGTLSSKGWLEIASGVTRVTVPGENAIGDGNALVFVSAGEANDYYGRLTVSSGAELYAPPELGYRRFHTESFANVEIIGGKVNMPKIEYLNTLSGGPSTLTISGDGEHEGELVCRDYRPSQTRVGDGGVLNLNNGGRLTVSRFRMDSDYPAVINFNGGIISRQSEFQEDTFISSYLNSNNFTNIQCNVLTSGAVFEPRNGANIFWTLPLKSGVAEGETDGGLTVRGENIFVMTVTGSDYNGRTRLEHGARMQCRAAQVLPSGTTLQMGSDTSIGFNVWTNYEDLAQTVARVESCGRIFRNSLLTVTEAVAPVFDGVYGTLTFEKACTLNGDYEITGDANGCSCIKLESGSSAYPTKQDISGLTLKVAGVSAFNRKTKYKILDAPYGYEGKFNLGNVPAPWGVVYTTNAAYLKYIKGTALTLR